LVDQKIARPFVAWTFFHFFLTKTWGPWKELRNFWIEGTFCDVILKSQDAKDREGREHKAHRNVLSSASKALRALLGDTFAESEQIRDLPL